MRQFTTQAQSRFPRVLQRGWKREKAREVRIHWVCELNNQIGKSNRTIKTVNWNSSKQVHVPSTILGLAGLLLFRSLISSGEFLLNSVAFVTPGMNGRFFGGVCENGECFNLIMWSSS